MHLSPDGDRIVNRIAIRPACFYPPMPPPLYKSVGYSFRGLKFVWREERSFRLELLGLVLTVIAGIWLQLSTQEWIAVWLASGFVLGAEVVNTITEEILDHLHPARHDTVGKIKDIGAGLVLLSAMTAAAVAGAIFIGRL